MASCSIGRTTRFFLGYSITYGLVMIAYGLAVFGNAATIVLTLQSRRRQSRPTAVRNEGPDVQTASCFVLSAALAAIATLGSLAHFETKAQFTEAWNRQLDMMQALRQLAPGLSNDTFVVVVDDRDDSRPMVFARQREQLLARALRQPFRAGQHAKSSTLSSGWSGVDPLRR